MSLNDLQYIPISEINRVKKSITDPILKSKILSDIFRINILYMIMRAGSGHPGTCLSCIDIVTWLWTQEMENPNKLNDQHSDTYFSSKGHDAPALYAVMLGLERLDFEYIHKLRYYKGLPGHPHAEEFPELITDTGTLGMGISKAHGMAIANRLQGKTGRFYVLTGDGELQEGQIWESLPSVAHEKLSEITVIVDHNKIQSDTWVKDVNDLNNLEDRFKSFGWEVFRCDGHNFDELKDAIAKCREVKDKPQVIIADTKKGAGVSLMEGVDPEDGMYKFHSGAPKPEDYTKALDELTKKVNTELSNTGQSEIITESFDIEIKPPRENPEQLIQAYGDELIKIAQENEKVVVFNADLVYDCGLIPFVKQSPDRFIESGIAEQDMVSKAGGLALKGMIPVVNSFSAFLSTRPNEQIYNNATERTKIVYMGSLAGVLPGGPGHSHQSVRDISALGSIPGLTLIEPSTEKEVRMALRWAIEVNPKSTYIRIMSLQFPIPYNLPDDYKLEVGKGVELVPGSDAAIIAYGPVMLRSAVDASKILLEKSIKLSVINLPWLNEIDEAWLTKTLAPFRTVFTLDDHYISFGQGERIASMIAKTRAIRPRLISLGLKDVPVCGQNLEVLKHHGLDRDSIVRTVEESIY